MGLLSIQQNFWLAKVSHQWWFQILYQGRKKNSESDEDEFILGTMENLSLDKDTLPPEAFVPRNIPSCFFSKPNEANNIFLKIEPDNTQFVMIKSDNFYDVQIAIKIGMWSSTAYGNKSLSSLYQKYGPSSNGNIYLFFSVNGSGHICAVGEMKSDLLENNEVPKIWLEKHKYSGCFMVRFILV